MQVVRGPRGGLKVLYTPTDRVMLGLPQSIDYQIMTDHWKHALLWLLDRGVAVERAMLFLRRGNSFRSFWRTNHLARRQRTGTSLSRSDFDMRRKLGHESCRAYAWKPRHFLGRPAR